MRPDLMLTGPAVGLENVQRLRQFEFNLDWFIHNFFIAPVPTLVPKHKFKSGEAITVTNLKHLVTCFNGSKIRRTAG